MRDLVTSGKCFQLKQKLSQHIKSRIMSKMKHREETFNTCWHIINLFFIQPMLSALVLFLYEIGAT